MGKIDKYIIDLLNELKAEVAYNNSLITRMTISKPVSPSEFDKAEVTDQPEQLSLFEPTEEDPKISRSSRCINGHRVDAIAQYFGTNIRTITAMMKAIGAEHFFYGDNLFKHRYYTNSDIVRIKKEFKLKRMVNYKWKHVE